ncbi:g3049 [Coccomyxa elongata]
MLVHSERVISQQQQGQPQPPPPAQMQGGELMSGMNSNSNGDSIMGSEVDARKLVILGLPWETTEASLEQHFSQIGPLQEVVIMKDRSTGKSRGFGFVTFFRAADAACAANQEHVVDGRRCEAKYALPRGGGPAPRTTRIFVARIPLSVSDAQFRQYFEQFGSVQDAYMPKDATKQSHRGIGFVTFASADSVEQVMSSPHSMNGQELAIDRATPKDKVGPLQLTNSSARLREIQQLAAAAAAAAYPAAAFASLGVVPSGGFPAGIAANAGLATSNYLPFGAPNTSMSYSAAVNGGFGLAGRAPGSDGQATDSAGNEFNPYAGNNMANGNGGGTTYSSGGGSSGGNLGAVAAFEGGNSGQAANSGGSGSGELFQPMRSDGIQRSSMDEDGGGGGHAPELTSSQLQDLRGLVQSGDHTAQALQGLTFGGNSDGIGIGLGMLQQQAHAGNQMPFQFNKQMGGTSVATDMDAQVRAQAILRSLAAPQARNAQLSDAQLAGLLAGNVDAAQLVNSIVNGAVLPGIPAPPPAGMPRQMGRLVGSRMQGSGGQFGGGGAMGKPSIDTRSGPRIFVGKLNKETTENDVKEYFTRFGYVMDVYLPRDKVNRSEHRGFGFVTFETDGAVLRIHAHGQHQIKGSVVAIDSAVPRREEGTRTDDDVSTSSMQVMDLGGDDLSLGPARNHPQERTRHGYKPY